MNFPEMFANCSNIKELLLFAEQYLEQNDIESAKLNAETIYCFCLNVSRFELRFELNKGIDNSTVSVFWNLIQQRASGKPLQYILGRSLFFNAEIIVNESVLIPRPETEELTSLIAKDMLAQSQYLQKDYIVLDICCGSGCIALLLAQFANLNMPFSKYQFYGIDISLPAITLANQNKCNLNLNNVVFENVSLEEFISKRQLCSTITQLPKYDYIVCNPPYIPLEDYNKLEKELFFEPKIALTDNSDGLSFYRQISQHLSNLLADCGNLYLECGHQQAQQIENMFINKGFTASIIKDFANINRFVKINHYCNH